MRNAKELAQKVAMTVIMLPIVTANTNTTGNDNKYDFDDIANIVAGGIFAVLIASALCCAAYMSCKKRAAIQSMHNNLRQALLSTNLVPMITINLVPIVFPTTTFNQTIPNGDVNDNVDYIPVDVASCASDDEAPSPYSVRL